MHCLLHRNWIKACPLCPNSEKAYEARTVLGIRLTQNPSRGLSPCTKKRNCYRPSFQGCHYIWRTWMGLLNDLGQMLREVWGCLNVTPGFLHRLLSLASLVQASVPATSTRTKLDTLVSSPLYLTTLKKRNVWLPSGVHRRLTETANMVWRESCTSW